MPRTRMDRPITYRDRQSRLWYVSEVARLKVVSRAIDGPNVALVIRFAREGEELRAVDRWRRLAPTGRVASTLRRGRARGMGDGRCGADT